MSEQAMLSQARALLEAWHCEPDGAPFTSHASLLWPVRRDGCPRMLKIVDPEDDEVGGAAILAALDGRGAVRLLQAEGPNQLMERVIPAEGPSLEEMVTQGRDDEATGIICEVIATLHAALPGTADLPLLIPFDRRSDDMREHLAEGRVPVSDLPSFHHAVGLGEEMIAESRSGWVPLHGDMHHLNVLEDQERGWLAIDPKGILGPRVSEYANTVCNPLSQSGLVTDPARMARQAAIIAERGGFAVEEVLRWAWLHAMQVAAWSLFEPDKSHWLLCAKVADELAGLSPR
jgi:streptomycin 6-kinase